VIVCCSPKCLTDGSLLTVLDTRSKVTNGAKEVQSEVKLEIRFEIENQEARELAKEILDKLVMFLNVFAQFVDKVYGELTGAGAVKGEDAWDLIQELIPEIFSDLRNARSGAQKSDTSPSYLWYSLKTHQVMQRYLVYNIRNDPTLTSAITRYILRWLGNKRSGDQLQAKFNFLHAKEHGTDQGLKSLKISVTT
jgi:hypothetical protein